jgi:type I restriction enzyme M protein
MPCHRIPLTTQPAARKPEQPHTAKAANIGYEAELWQMADALRGSMDAAEYKHIVLRLLSPKDIFDASEEQHAALLVDTAGGTDPEDPDK